MSQRPRTVKITVEEQPDILARLVDLHKQATTERSHYYVAKVVVDAMHEIARLRLKCGET